MITSISHIISQLKGQQYQIDERIGKGYLMALLMRHAMMLIWGRLSGIRQKGWLFLSPGATVRCKNKLRAGRGVSIHRGSFIDALSVEGVVLGDNVSVGANTRINCTGNLQYLGKGLRAGNNVGLGYHAFYGCAGGIVIGDDTIIGDFVSFHAENHNYRDADTPIRLQGVSHRGIRVGANCWIGAKSTILDGAIIEDGCVIAAGSIVKAGFYEANGVYAGVPARLVKYRIEEVLSYGR